MTRCRRTFPRSSWPRWVLKTLNPKTRLVRCRCNFKLKLTLNLSLSLSPFLQVYGLGRIEALQIGHAVASFMRRGPGGAPPPPPLRTKWTRRVLHPVLIGHAASFNPY